MILGDFRKLPLLIHPAEEIAESAWSLASGFDRSFYDSLYLALAERQSCPMVTADRRLWNAVGSVLPSLVWIEDLS